MSALIGCPQYPHLILEAALDMVADLSALGFSGRVSKQAVKGILARVYLNAAGRLENEDYYDLEND